MSQMLINSLTDDLSAARADVARLERAADEDAHRVQWEITRRRAAEVELVETLRKLVTANEDALRYARALREAVLAARTFNRGGMTWLEYDAKLVELEQIATG